MAVGVFVHLLLLLIAATVANHGSCSSVDSNVSTLVPIEGPVIRPFLTRAGGDLGVFRFVLSVHAVMGQGASVCYLLAAMRSPATSPTGLLGSVLSSLKPVTASDAAFDLIPHFFFFLILGEFVKQW